MIVRFKKLDPNAKKPEKQYTSDAAFDLTATSFSFDGENDVISYGMGIAVEIPYGYVGLLFPRSSVYLKKLDLSDCVGVIDSGYRGEVTAKFRITNGFIGDKKEPYYNVGDRVAQLIIIPIPLITFQESSVLSDSDRGTGGYGSTGL